MFVDSFPGADPSGLTPSDAAVSAAVTAMSSHPGVLEFGAGHYKLTTPNPARGPGQPIKGAGLGATVIDYHGSGDCFRVHDTATTNPGTAGPIDGLTILGWNAHPKAVGLHVGDILNLQLNVAVAGFNQPGSIGIHAENQSTYSERGHWNVVVEQCTTAVLFEGTSPTNSFDYSTYNIVTVCMADQDGVVIRNDCQLAGVDFALKGNFVAGPTNSGTVLTIGETPTDASQLIGAINVFVETDGAGVGHKNIQRGPAALFQGDGMLVFGGWAVPFTPGTTAWHTGFLGRYIVGLPT